jgi:anti-anti-sigma factor
MFLFFVYLSGLIPKAMFTVSIEREESLFCIIPEGRLDTLTSELFQEKLQPVLDKDDFLIIDFSRCHYLSSSGIRILLTVSKKLGSRGGRLALSNLPVEIFQVLEMAGLHAVFSIFEDVETARFDLLWLKQKASQHTEMHRGDHTYHMDQREPENPVVSFWHKKSLAGYNELGVAAGIGSPAETLAEDEKEKGLFFTAGNCSGFIPYDRQKSPEFRVVHDPMAGGIFVSRAFSFTGTPSKRIRLIAPEYTSLEQLLTDSEPVPEEGKIALPELLVVADFHPSTPSLYILHPSGGESSELFREIENQTGYPFVHTSHQKQSFWGIRFFLNALPELLSDDPFLDFINRALTIHTIERVEIPDLSAPVKNPVVWVFHPEEQRNADAFRIHVEVPEGAVFEPYQYFLTRRLYTDSARVMIRPLHGGYSAQTFQVESYDPQGRRLRPTVLKTATREMIAREAKNCRDHSLPYIMNNSAMVLGTAFFCNAGALRYNFVGIGGEQSRLKWLTHYFVSWPVEKLEPLFDKIFLQILNPWYGQPVREKIYPFRDYNPQKTFFPHLCETAGEVLSLSADEPTFFLDKTGKKRINPYWFLKHEYKKRTNEAMDYYTSICHGDLNMQNILLDEAMNVYLIDFSETKPRSVVSDFARLEAIFMVEQAPINNRAQLEEMIPFVSAFYEEDTLDHLPEITWTGTHPIHMNKNIALTLKMRKYAISATSGDPRIIPYYTALLEWIFPIVCYKGVDRFHKKLSAVIASIVCEKIMFLTNEQKQRSKE